MTTRLCAILMAMAICGLATAATINVPADYTTIQAAIDAASVGDEILVSPGTYMGTGNWVINPHGKPITIRATGTPEETILNGQGHRCVVQCSGAEGADTIIEGFTITGGSSATSGGGINCSNSSPTITGCTITDNTANNFGGGIRFSNSSATITSCTISANTATYNGGGIYCHSGSPTITSCTITNNTASKGGGIYCSGGSPTITSCTFSGNTPDNVYGDPDWNPLRNGGGLGIITLENCMLCGTGHHVVGPINHVGENIISDCTEEGDIDNDGDVDADDLSALHAATGICQSDVNHDGATDIDDLMDLIAGWDSVCP